MSMERLLRYVSAMMVICRPKISWSWVVSKASSLPFWVWVEVAHEVQEQQYDEPVEVVVGKWSLVVSSNQLPQIPGS